MALAGGKERPQGTGWACGFEGFHSAGTQRFLSKAWLICLVLEKPPLRTQADLSQSPPVFGASPERVCVWQASPGAQLLSWSQF